MEGITEIYTIKITESGLAILSGKGKSLHFTATQALMLLDILREEEQRLKQMAQEASPIPIKIQV